MTQTAEPIRLTVPMLTKVLTERCPSVLPKWDTLKDKLSDPKSKDALGKLISLEVESEVQNGLTFYRWHGKQGVFQLEVPRAFEPNGQATPAPAPPTAAQPSGERGEGASNVPKTKQAVQALQQPSQQVTQEDQAQEEAPQPEPETKTDAPTETLHHGLFTALAELLGESTLLMTVARTGEKSREPVLTVTVVPQGEAESFTPVCLEGAVSELDAHFISALRTKAQNRKSLEAAIEELKAADKELEEAKKKEVGAKKKQAESKKKSAGKKEEKVEEKKAEAEKQQEALF